MKVTANVKKIAREELDLATFLDAMPGNPIPWEAIIRVVGPIIARLAVRYALKRLKRDMSEDKVNAIGRGVGTYIGDIIAKRTAKRGPK